MQLGRDLSVEYKTAFVLAHKLRAAMYGDQAEYRPRGEIEVDGCHVGGSIKQTNYKANWMDRRLAVHKTGKRRVVVAMRGRNGRTQPFIVDHEAEATANIRARVAVGSTIYADEASACPDLHASFEAKRVNHGFAFSDDGACTNQVESFFSRLRRAEFGQHHRISDKHLHQYAGEMAWREDMRRVDNGTQYERIGRDALRAPKSASWCGYWQRAV